MATGRLLVRFATAAGGRPPARTLPRRLVQQAPTKELPPLDVAAASTSLLSTIDEQWKQRLAFRLDRLRTVDPGADEGAYKSHWERLLREDADLRGSTSGIAARRLVDLPTNPWMAMNGPKHLRWLAKAFGILAQDESASSLMPYETEAKVNLRLGYGSGNVAIGGVVLPEDATARPTVAFECVAADRPVSLVMWDMDAQNLCLWLVYQHVSRVSAVPYWPPHPSRGTGYHRIVAALVEHDSAPGNEDRQSVCRTVLSHLQSAGVLGYVFFRTVWTRSVLGIVAAHGGMQDSPLAEHMFLRHHGANPRYIRIAARLDRQQQPAQQAQ